MSVRVRQEIFNYLGFSNSKSRCGLTILPLSKDKVIVVLSELAANPGASITNRYAEIGTAVYEEFLSHVSVHDITWIEHYNRDSYDEHAGGEESFTLVGLTWDDRKKAFYAPQWRFCSQELIETMLNSLDLLGDNPSVVTMKANRP